MIIMEAEASMMPMRITIIIIIITVISTITFIIRSAAFSTNHGSC